MDFVGEHRTLVRRLARLLLLPRAVLPFVFRHVVRARRRLRFFLRIEPVGIRLHDARSAPLRLDGVFIDLALAESLDKGLPDLAVGNTVHRVQKGIPIIEHADNTDGFRVRRPHRKAHAAFSVPLEEMRTQHLLCMIICPLVKEVKIKLT